MKKIVLGLALVLMLSGCSGLPSSLQSLIPGMSSVNTTELGPDIIVIQDINVIPSSAISTGDTFSVSFEIKNQDDINEVPMDYRLYDSGLCQPPSTGASTTQSIMMAPQQTEFKEWKFVAPTNDKTESLSTTCPIRFLVNYTFNAASQIDAEVISLDNLEQYQRAGQAPTFTPSLTVGRGPVKVYLSFGGSLPARNDSILPMFITVQDKGSGLLRSIMPGKLSIVVPDDFGSVKCNKMTESDSGGNRVLTNSEAIPMIKKSSSQMRCELLTPSSDKIGDLEKTYFISAKLQYTYELTGETDVSIKPTMT